MKHVLPLVVLASLAVACGGKNAEKSGGGETPEEAQKRAMTIDPPAKTHLYEEKFVIGRRMEGPVAVDATDIFKQGETVHVSFLIYNPPPASECRVQWKRVSDEKVMAEEKKLIPQKPEFLAFRVDTATWEPGDYRLMKEITSGDPNVPWKFLGSKDFKVTAP